VVKRAGSLEERAEPPRRDDVHPLHPRVGGGEEQAEEPPDGARAQPRHAHGAEFGRDLDAGFVAVALRAVASVEDVARIVKEEEDGGGGVAGGGANDFGKGAHWGG